MIHERPVGPADVPAILAMLTRAYRAAREDFPDDPDVLGAYGAHDPGGHPGRWVALYDGDRPVAALRLFPRRVRTHAGDLAVGGIGNVGTDPDHGGRGLGRRVMDAAHRRLRDAGATHAVLVTDIPEFYRRFGYAVVPQPELRGRLDAVTPGGRSDDARRLVAPVPESVLGAHLALTRHVTGRVLRTPETWQRWILEFKGAGSLLDGWWTPRGYLIGRPEEAGAYRIFEAGGSAAAVAELLPPDVPLTLLKTPDDPVCRALQESLGARVETRVRTGIMSAALSDLELGPEGFAGFLELDLF